MRTPTLNLQPIDIRHASEREYLALHQFDNLMRAERDPDDPPHTVIEDIQGWQNIPPFIVLHNRIVWGDDGEQIIASGGGGFADFPENRHLMFCSLEVLPDFRRRGLARLLLSHTVDAAQQANRRVLVAETYSTVPAGEAFAKRIGARMALEERISHLDMRSLDRNLVRRWIEDGQRRASDFELGFWIGSYPEADLLAICELTDVMNT
ncbi:MAG: GNAT family N-acetyltransferase, partial [Chloroflexi bacterium]|nr:GNAT family N-acetyltransferase [Chloroflexota bacterium]